MFRTLLVCGCLLAVLVLSVPTGGTPAANGGTAQQSCLLTIDDPDLEDATIDTFAQESDRIDLEAVRIETHDPEPIDETFEIDFDRMTGDELCIFLDSDISGVGVTIQNPAFEGTTIDAPTFDLTFEDGTTDTDLTVIITVASAIELFPDLLFADLDAQRGQTPSDGR